MPPLFPGVARVKRLQYQVRVRHGRRGNGHPKVWSAFCAGILTMPRYAGIFPGLGLVLQLMLRNLACRTFFTVPSRAARGRGQEGRGPVGHVLLGRRECALSDTLRWRREVAKDGKEEEEEAWIAWGCVRGPAAAPNGERDEAASMVRLAMPGAEQHLKGTGRSIGSNSAAARASQSGSYSMPVSLRC